MHCDYADIRERIQVDPIWFDENAVPRYVPFSPNQAANIYASEVALLEIACQCCRRPFLVCMSWNMTDQARGVPALSAGVRDRTIGYGDPPNVWCCASGPTMTSEPIRVVEFWRKASTEFMRIPEFEVAIEAPWAKDR